jgi:hypothetical protein
LNDAFVVKKNRDILLAASEEVGVEINAEKNKCEYILMSCEENAE